jgi:hypothetical protein
LPTGAVAKARAGIKVTMSKPQQVYEFSSTTDYCLSTQPTALISVTYQGKKKDGK